MLPKSAKLAFKASKHCFLAIPRSWLDYSIDKKLIALKVESSTSVMYSVWLNDTTSEDSVEVNGLFGAKQGFRNGEVVCVTCVLNVPVCSSVSVEPASADDWEILEMNSAAIESNLLNQIRLVATGHVFPIWVHKTVCIFIKIGLMQPESECCLLEANTQVIISPKIRYSAGHMLNSVDRKSDFEQAASVRVGSEESVKPENVSNDSQLTVFTRAAKWISSLWQGDELPATEPCSRASYQPELWTGSRRPERTCSCRVLPLEDFNFVSSSTLNKLHCTEIGQTDADESVTLWPALNQSSNVYVGLQTIAKGFRFYSNDDIPMTFLAVLIYLDSPSDQQRKLSASNKNQRSSKTHPDESSALDEGSKFQSKAVVRVVVLNLNEEIAAQTDVHLEKQLPFGHILVSPLLRRQLTMSAKGRVVIEPLMASHECAPTELLCYPLCPSPEGFLDDMLEQAVHHWLRDCGTVQFPTVISRGTAIRCNVTEAFSMDFAISFDAFEHSNTKDSDCLYCLVGPDLLDGITIKLNKQLIGTLSTVSESDKVHQVNALHRFSYDMNMVSEATRHIEVTLSTGPLAKQIIGSCSGLQAGCLLVYGPRGAGKTTFCNALCSFVESPPRFGHTQMVDCKQLRGKKPESIGSKIQAVLNDALWYQPSVLVLDDLDQIAAASSGPDQEMAPEAQYYARVAQEIRLILKNGMSSASAVCVVATCQNRNSLHQNLASGRGQHFFSRFIELKVPNYDQRIQLLKVILAEKRTIASVSYDEDCLKEVAAKTEGFAARDLKTVTDRAVHAFFIDNVSSSSNQEMNACSDTQVVLTIREFLRALDEFKPAGLLNVQLLPPGQLTWADVGGLHQVRDVLEQTLFWPAKYPKLFSSCPLRLRSGLLLYGAPGTGKTLLAGVVAKEFALNFISIKGPELLNKYIGASESAVRETFARAQSARPCVLFFDEFDSLAPRRGHDSTGVTDRVVNQLLTQLDGVEKLEGVFVLAATSRPDLIDPALLRPGRLDKMLHCPLPSEDERFEIFKALSRNMSLSSDVDLRVLASRSEHFTGADIKALLYNAQLSALNSDNTILTADNTESERWQSPGDITYIPSLEKGPIELDSKMYEQLSRRIKSLTGEEDKDPISSCSVTNSILVTQQHLLSAASTTRPSVPASERSRYDMIYQSFVSSRVGDFADNVQSVGDRVTLA